MTSKTFTVPHFRAWAKGLILDTGQPWILEPFQARFLKDVFAGYLEAWLVIPEGNAKTTLLAALCLYHAQFREFASITVAAAARDQARWLFLSADGFVQRSPAIKPVFKCQEGYLRIKCASSGSRIQVYSSDERVGDGAQPTLAVLEELHRHRDLNLYRTWRGKVEKRGGQLIAISTAGEPDGEFEATRKRIRDEATSSTQRGAFLRATSETTVLHEYAVPEEGDPDHIPTVKKANPLSTITLKMLKTKHDSPAMVPSHWRRINCGMPARLDSWLGPAEWDRLKTELGNIVPGDEVTVGLRVGAEIGIGLASLRGEGVAVKMIPIPAPVGSRVPLKVVEGKLRELDETYDLIDVVYDPDHFERSAELLKDEGLPMTKGFQSPKQLTIATSTLWRLVSGRLLNHDGDPDLRRQVLAGRTKETQQGWRIEPTGDTAGLVAVMIAAHHATDTPPSTLTMILPSTG